MNKQKRAFPVERGEMRGVVSCSQEGLLEEQTLEPTTDDLAQASRLRELTEKRGLSGKQKECLKCTE